MFVYIYIYVYKCINIYSIYAETTLTFDSNLCCGFDYAQGGHGDTGVVGGLPDVSDF